MVRDSRVLTIKAFKEERKYQDVMYNGRSSSLGIIKIYLLSGIISCEECDYTAVPGSILKDHNEVKHESRNKNVNKYGFSRNPRNMKPNE